LLCACSDQWADIDLRSALLFYKHYAEGSSFPWDLLEGAKGVQLAELGLQSWREHRWVDVPELK